MKNTSLVTVALVVLFAVQANCYITDINNPVNEPAPVNSIFAWFANWLMTQF